jgi:hypothetical protein
VLYPVILGAPLPMAYIDMPGTVALGTRATAHVHDAIDRAEGTSGTMSEVACSQRVCSVSAQDTYGTCAWKEDGSGDVREEGTDRRNRKANSNASTPLFAHKRREAVDDHRSP